MDEKWFKNGRVNVSSDIQSVLETVDPVNPATGLRDGLLDRMSKVNLSQSERDLIGALLTKMPAGERNSMSDEDMISMLPSRYNSSLTDIESVRQVLSEIAQTVDSVPDVAGVVDSAPDVSSE